MVAARNTRKEILKTATRLIQQRGFNGFSYRDISEPLGIRNAAIHYHFPAKGDLGAAMIEHYRSLLRESTADFMANGGDAREQIEGFLQWTERQHERGIPMCPGGALAAEFSSLPEQMQERTRKLHGEVLAWLTHVLKAGREQGTLAFSGDPEDRALMIYSTVLGARQSARYGGREELTAVLDMVRQDLGLVGETKRDPGLVAEGTV